jgi:hypothetical protein
MVHQRMNFIGSLYKYDLMNNICSSMYAANQI